MKIVFVGYFPRYGGAGKSMIAIANALSDMGHDVNLVFINKEEEAIYKANEKIKTYFVLKSSKSKINSYLHNYKSIKKYLKEIKPDITVTFWTVPAIMLAMMRKSITGKAIYSERGDPGDKEYNGLLGFVRDIMFKRLDGFVFQIKGAQQYFPEKIRAKSAIIHNPVYIKYEDFEIAKLREKKIVTAGRLHPQKNHKLLIEAFAKISDKYPDYVLEIWGEGNLQQSLQSKIDSLNLSQRVLLKGATKEILNKMVSASLFVLSSDYEGMPNALMEAMALGVPCITTDCKPGGARELIKNNINGIITPIGDVDKLAQAMDELLKDKDKAERLSVEAKNICETNKKERIFKIWEIYLESVVNNEQQ